MDRYAAVHHNPQGLGDARPTAEQIIRDQDLVGRWADKTVLITGGTAGLGTESARILHLTGAKVFITARSTTKGKEVAERISANNPSYPPVEFVEMDLGSLESVRKGATDFLRRSDKLNVLMTNAGVMACPEGRTTDGFETQFGTNHLAHFLLFQLLKPTLLEASTPRFQSRVISLSSAGHRGGGIHPENYALEGIYKPFVAYAQSKTANIYMANEIERRYGSCGLHAWSVHPGVIFETSICRHQPGESDGLQGRLRENDARLEKYIKTTEQGAATQVWAAVAKELEGKGGLYLDDVQVGREFVETSPAGFLPGYLPYIYDEELAKQLWKDSERMVGEEDSF